MLFTHLNLTIPRRIKTQHITAKTLLPLVWMNSSYKHIKEHSCVYAMPSAFGSLVICRLYQSCKKILKRSSMLCVTRIHTPLTVAILAQGTSWAVADTQAFCKQALIRIELFHSSVTCRLTENVWKCEFTMLSSATIFYTPALRERFWVRVVGYWPLLLAVASRVGESQYVFFAFAFQG